MKANREGIEPRPHACFKISMILCAIFAVILYFLKNVRNIGKKRVTIIWSINIKIFGIYFLFSDKEEKVHTFLYNGIINIHCFKKEYIKHKKLLATSLDNWYRLKYCWTIKWHLIYWGGIKKNILLYINGKGVTSPPFYWLPFHWIERCSLSIHTRYSV